METDSVAGYLVFHRMEGDAYDYSEPAWGGTETSCTIEIADEEGRHCFVARAFDTHGFESMDSDEICLEYTVYGDIVEEPTDNRDDGNGIEESPDDRDDGNSSEESSDDIDDGNSSEESSDDIDDGNSSEESSDDIDGGNSTEARSSNVDSENSSEGGAGCFIGCLPR